MKLIPPNKGYRCSHIIQPGEFITDRWDGEQCTVTNPSNLIRCPECGESFCLTFHWAIHSLAIANGEVKS